MAGGIPLLGLTLFVLIDRVVLWRLCTSGTGPPSTKSLAMGS